MRYFEFVHNLGIHSWDIPALIVAVILVVMILVHRHNQKKREKDFEEELDQKIQDLREELDKKPARKYNKRREHICHIFLNIQDSAFAGGTFLHWLFW